MPTQIQPLTRRVSDGSSGQLAEAVQKQDCLAVDESELWPLQVLWASTNICPALQFDPPAPAHAWAPGPLRWPGPAGASAPGRGLCFWSRDQGIKGQGLVLKRRRP